MKTRVQSGCCVTPFGVKQCRREGIKCVLILVLLYFVYKQVFQKSQKTRTLFKIDKSLRKLSNLSTFSRSKILRENQASSLKPIVIKNVIKYDFVEPCRFPWAEENDKTCQKFRVCFAAPGTFKSRALLSFPGSGNTWARYMIESASGFFTGSVYNDTVLFKSGYLGELRAITDGTTVFQKYHNFYKQPENVKLFEYRAVIIIRNPFDALITYRHYKATNFNHTAHADKKFFMGKGWADFVKKEANNWKKLIVEWVANSSDYLLVLYEDLRENPTQELKRILDHVSVDNESDKRIACLLRPSNLQGSFRRESKLAGNETTGLTNSSTLSSKHDADSPTVNNITVKEISKLSENKQFIISFIQHCIDEVNIFFMAKRVMLTLPYTLQSSRKIEMYL